MSEKRFTAENFELKNDLVDRVLLVGTTIGLGVFIVSLFPWNDLQINADFFGDLAGIGILFATYFFRQKLALYLKVNIINIILMTLLISDLFENGINTPDFILLVLIPFFLILVYKLRTTLIIYGACSIIFIGIGYGYHFGFLSSPDYDISDSSIFRWYETFLILSVVTFVIVLFVDKFNNRLYKLIQNLEDQNDKLIQNQSVIKESLDEKSVLLQEIHHRVKNNLAVVSGLLSLQSSHIENPQLKLILEENVNRILSIAKVHQMLYESDNFNNISFNGYIQELSDIILSTLNQEGKNIQFSTDITVETLSINHGVPLGIIFNELITNSVKYAFQKDEENEIRITVKQSGESINVVYSDNGIGIHDFENAQKKSLGFTLIASLLDQIDANSSYETEGKFMLTFTFNIENNDPDLAF